MTKSVLQINITVLGINFILILIIGVASDRGWSRTQSAPHVDAHSVRTWQVGRARGRRLPREGGVRLEGVPEIGFFISTVPL